MSNHLKVQTIFALLSSCAFLFSACGEGSGGNTPPPNPPVITAQATIPSSVTANTAFTVSVLLTASDGSPVTASVQVVDVGTVTPLIDCGPAQTLAAGISRNFTCQAPQVNLGGDNTHQLQVTVDGDSNLPAAIPVEVVASGQVDVQLTDESGALITAVEPAQTFNVAFSTTTTHPGHGTYTVTAPDGWTVGDGVVPAATVAAVGTPGVCEIKAEQPECQVPVTAPESLTSGSPADIKISAASGSTPPSRSEVNPDKKLIVLYVAQNISDTLYADSGGLTFKYQPVFLLKNKSKDSVDIKSVTVNGLTNVKYACKVVPSAQADYTWSETPPKDCSLPEFVASASTTAAQLYAVTGDLNSHFKISAPLPASAPTPASSSSIAISVYADNDNSHLVGKYNATVAFVKYQPDLVAVRVVNKTKSGYPVNVAAVHENSMITFDLGTHVGTASSISSHTAFAEHQLKLTTTGGLFYMPKAISEAIYLTRDKGGFNDENVPNPTGLPMPPAYLCLS